MQPPSIPLAHYRTEIDPESGALLLFLQVVRPCKTGELSARGQVQELAPGVIAIGYDSEKIDFVPRVIRVDPACDPATLKGVTLSPFYVIDGLTSYMELGGFVQSVKAA